MPERVLADVIVPVYRDTGVTVDCLESVLAFSGPSLRSLIVIDDASPEPGMSEALARVARSDSRMLLLRNEENAGFVTTCNRGLAKRAGDAVLLNSDTRVTRGWLVELADVVHSDSRTACASPLSNSATIYSVPAFNAETRVDHVDAECVRAACAGLPRWTEMPTGHGFCLYMRGDVLDLVGLLDPVFSPGYNEENDWVMRAEAMGFVAKRANHAFVYHLGSQSFGGKRLLLEERNARILAARHPHYQLQVARFNNTLDARVAAHAVRVASTGKMRVALDLRHLPPDQVGGHAYPAELATVLAGMRDVELTLMVDDPRDADGIAGRVVFDEDRIDDVEVIHRPVPVTDAADLPLLLASPAHLVITHPDVTVHGAGAKCSARSMPDRFRATAAVALLATQATISLSETARCEIADEFGIPLDEVALTRPGLDRQSRGGREEEWERTARLTVDVYQRAVFRPTERSLRARRQLQEPLIAWAAVAGDQSRASSAGIRNAWRDLNHAIHVRIKRELRRIRSRTVHRSA